MKVSMIVWNDFQNDSRVLKEIETLRDAGLDVQVFALHTPGKTKKEEILRCGATVTRIARSPLWSFRKKTNKHSYKKLQLDEKNINSVKSKDSIVRQLLKIIARSWTHTIFVYRLVKSRPDVIHAHDVNVLPTAWLASKFSKSFLIYDAHEISTDREGYKSFRNIVACIEKWIMPSVDGSITTTELRAKFFARAYNVERPIVLQNRPRSYFLKHSTRIRDELKLLQPWPIVLYQGGLQRGRGLHNLVRAASYVDNAYFVFIGGGREEASLQKLTADLGIEEKIFFIPTVSLDDLPLYTASADIGVQPIENTCLNHFTTDSNKLFEYVLAGLPVIASSLPEITKIVKRYDVGVLVPPGNLSVLASTINELLTNIEEKERLRLNAIHAASKLTWESQEDCLIQLYDKVLKSYATKKKSGN